MAQFESQESVFNMALAYLMRIDKLLYKVQEAALAQNIDDWRNYLRAVYREASVKLKDNEKKDILGDSSNKLDIKKLLDNNIDNTEANFLNINYLSNNPQLKITNKKTILFLLDALDVKIRGYLQLKGMLLPSRDDPNYAVLRR